MDDRLRNNYFGLSLSNKHLYNLQGGHKSVIDVSSGESDYDDDPVLLVNSEAEKVCLYMGAM